jgi:hypothetical protein
LTDAENVVLSGLSDELHVERLDFLKAFSLAVQRKKA